jgi:hypothetical protein
MKKTEDKTFMLYEYELWSNVENKFMNRTLLLTKAEADTLNTEWSNYDLEWLRTNSEKSHDGSVTVEKSVSMVLTVTKQTFLDRVLLYLTISGGFTVFTMLLSLLVDSSNHGFPADWLAAGFYLAVATICGFCIGAICFGVCLVFDFINHAIKYEAKDTE